MESAGVAMDIDMNSESSSCTSNSEYTNDVTNSCPVTNIVSTEVAMNIDISYESESSVSNSEPNIASVDSASHANSDPNSTNDLETAKHNLVTYVTDNSFTIHYVQGDGYCLYTRKDISLISNAFRHDSSGGTLDNLRPLAMACAGMLPRVGAALHVQQIHW